MNELQKQLYDRIKEPSKPPALVESNEAKSRLNELESWISKYDKQGDQSAKRHRMRFEINTKRDEWHIARAEVFVEPYLPPNNIEYFKKQWIKQLDKYDLEDYVKYPNLAMKSFLNDYEITKAQDRDKDEWEHLASQIATYKTIFDNQIVQTKSDKQIIDTYFFAKAEEFANLRAEIEKYADITPIAEFGTNYAEFYHDGNRAVQKVLAEQQGQVAGAFYRDDLGDITLTWGNDKMGLKHILDRRKEDFLQSGFTQTEAEQKAFDFIKKDLVNIMQNGKLRQGKTRAFLEVMSKDEKEVGVIALNHKDNENTKWIITAYMQIDSLGSAYSHQNPAYDPRLQRDSSRVESNINPTTNTTKSQATPQSELAESKPKIRRQR